MLDTSSIAKKIANPKPGQTTKLNHTSSNDNAALHDVSKTSLGVVELKCPYCGPRKLNLEVIVDQKSIPEMFYTIRNAYERILFLQGWDSKKIREETKLRQSVIINRRVIPS
jgi:hypothetical protein